MDNEKYKSILLELSKNLLAENVESIKFYYSEKIGVGEKIKTPIELLRALEQHLLLGIDNYDAFAEVLKKIGRNDLAKYFSETSCSSEKDTCISAKKETSNSSDGSNLQENDQNVLITRNAPRITAPKEFLSNALKQYYCKAYETVEEYPLPLNQVSQVKFLDKFVFPHLVDTLAVQHDPIFSERENFLRNQMNNQLFSFENHFKDFSLFLISGIAAIGKTWLLKKFLLDWSNGSIWKNIDLVFYLECRQLNLNREISSINDLLNFYYKNILDEYVISLDFTQSNLSIIFIIDGLNELEFFEHLINSTQESLYVPIVNVLAEIFKYKAVISGRVNAISQYENKVKSCKDKLTIRVVGYNENEINSYLEKKIFRKNNVKCLVESFLNESSIAKAMATVPFFLSCICNLTELFEKYPSKNITMTDLYSFYFLNFCNRHYFNERFEKLYEMMNYENNKQHIFDICKMAYNFFIENKLIFFDDEMNSYISNFDQNKYTGFIEKIESSYYGQYYQFCHLSMMELCVSIYAYNSFSGDFIMAKPKLKTCLPIICGLLNTNRTSFNHHLANLNCLAINKISLNDVIAHVPKELNYKCLFQDCQDPQKLFMQCFFESQALINTDDLKMSINERRWMITINNTKNSYEDKCEKYFVDKLISAEMQVSTLLVDKNKLTQEERDCITKRFWNKGASYIDLSYRFFIDKVINRWINE